MEYSRRNQRPQGMELFFVKPIILGGDPNAESRLFGSCLLGSLPDGCGAAGGVVSGLFHEQAGFQLYNIAGLCFDVLAESRGTCLLDVGVGVFPVGEDDDAYFHIFFKGEVEAAQGCPYPGGIAIVEDGQVLGKALDQADLPDGEGSTGGRDGIFDTVLVQGDNIGIAFYQDTGILLADSGFSLESTVEHLAFLVDVRLGGIDVFRRFGVVVQDASGECDDLSALAMDGEYDAVPEKIAVMGGGQAQFSELVYGVAF